LSKMTNESAHSNHSHHLLHLQGNLKPSTLILLEEIQAWGKHHVEPYIAEHWDKATFPPHVLMSFRQHFPQLLGFTLPKKYVANTTGISTASATAVNGFELATRCQITMTLARIDASFATTLLVQYGLCAESILLCGTDEQRQRLLPPLARLDVMGCFCLTEPQSGSDASNLTTTAIRVHGGYHITGSKRWIGNAIIADVFVVWAKNMSLPGNPVMGFLVERKHQQQPIQNSIQTSKIHGKVSMRMLQNANVTFHNAFCPESNVMRDHGTFVRKNYIRGRRGRPVVQLPEREKARQRDWTNVSLLIRCFWSCSFLQLALQHP
jgi:alkylation response protein AidB-like acyl-CoA dehydrogenase